MRRAGSAGVALAWALMLALRCAGAQASPERYLDYARMIRDGRADELRDSLSAKSRADVNLRGRQLLMALAVSARQPQVIAVLVDWGVGVDRPLTFSPEGQTLPITPLELAIADHAPLPVAAMLLQRGADPNRAVDGLRPLTLALEMREYDVAAALLDHGADVVPKPFAGEGTPMTPLMALAFSAAPGDPRSPADADVARMAERLVAAGAEVNARSHTGATALHVAVRTGGPAFVRALLAAHADPDIATSQGETPRQLAHRLGRDKIAALLDAAGSVRTSPPSGRATAACCALVSTAAPARSELSLPVPIERALLLGDQAAVRRWLTVEHVAGLDSRRRSDLLSTLIVQADVEDVDAAMRAGIGLDDPIDIEADDETARVTPLNDALTAEGDAAVARRLVELGADVSRHSVDDNPPLITAVGLGHYDLMEPLMARGADPDVSDEILGLTPLILLTRERDPARLLPALESLARHGVHVDVAAATGHTALLAAAQSGNEAAFDWLLAHGADWRRATTRGDTALSLARLPAGLADKSGIVRTLERLAADPPGGMPQRP